MSHQPWLHRLRLATRFVGRSVLALFIVLAAGPAALAADDKAGPKDVPYDHLNGGATSFVRDLKNGEQITVIITNTCPGQFEYEIRGFPKEAPPKVSGLSVPAPKSLEPKKLPPVHDTKYGGYVIFIRKIDGKPACQGGENLGSQMLLISVREANWDLSFTGAFTISGLTNPVYGFKTDPDGQTKRVIEDQAKQDSASLGIAAFVHVFHQSHPWVAPVFGLGIRADSKTEYFLGGAIRMNDKAAINAGVVFGPVNRLPAGVNPGDVVTDDNLLTSPATRTGTSFFVAFSDPFLNVRSYLEKPFAGEAAGTAAPATTTPAVGGEPASCEVQATKDDMVKLATLSSKGGTLELNLEATAECDWTLVWLDQKDKALDKGPAWVTRIDLTHQDKQKTGKVGLTFTENKTAEARTARFRLGTKTAIELTQPGAK